MHKKFNSPPYIAVYILLNWSSLSALGLTCLLFYFLITQCNYFLVFFFRWEVIANYMNQHSTSGIRRNAKDVINKAKNLQRLGETQCLQQNQPHNGASTQSCFIHSVVVVQTNKSCFGLIDEPPVLSLSQILCRRTRSTEKPLRSLRRSTTRSRPL